MNTIKLIIENVGKVVGLFLVFIMIIVIMLLDLFFD